MRVHEELQAQEVEISYQALTAFCRRHHLGRKPKVAAGRYLCEPGQEAQHDTSPHMAEIGGTRRRVQSASTVLGFSRTLFFQGYPRFRRFECKIFLTESWRYFDGIVGQTIIDNTSVVVLHGTGSEMVPVPEMAAFAERYGFTFVAHEKGDANRSAKVESRFSHIENNFYAGRTFRDFEDLNQQARAWCDKVNATYKRHLRAIPKELFALERAHLKPLPLWVPEPYLLHHRTIDTEGYVNLDTNRYSVPEDWIGLSVQVRETQGNLLIDGSRGETVTHHRLVEAQGKRITLKEHRRPRRRRRKTPSREEEALLREAPELADYIVALKKKGRKQPTLALRRLLGMVRDYPRVPLISAIEEAAHYGLYDLERVERMVLRRIAHEYFLIKPDGGDPK